MQIDDHCVPARIELDYTSSNAYAVSLHLVSPRPCTAPECWEFARDLLAEGITQPAGLGAVRVRPLTQDWITLDLVDAHGSAILVIATDDMRAFLGQTYRLVPPGQESFTLDWDDALRQLTR
ncbi:SsgA family sporulation/cell division regulator [Streptacidiphilus neutrinimicus]|uniref:SsgA family sporulation/cell division regulator n=1 Tax=Streptacidiphilus neutrinimicus TaxID=105420 RepID=UPI0013777460|nr:SsgA family sporulation/cell division regulator [Streptacidiphilus neutrinimicus]